MPPTFCHRLGVRGLGVRGLGVRGFGVRGFGAPVVAWLALAGQLALLADGAIAHVTCAVHGDLVHATSVAPARASSTHVALSAALASDDGLHDRCLVDEDGDVACRPTPTTLPTPARVAVARVDFAGGEGSPRLRAPLYRLAPKNSPPV